LTNLSESFGDVELRPEHSYGMGAVQALEITGETSVSAAADPRRDGTAWTS
jgi:gamma-glutamyltranspeptidase